ncbi:hypothetical protein JYT16_00435 [Gemmatimonas aurantiaca]|nr:hypothetical protein [Gemmatimonas aurantiaca]
MIVFLSFGLNKNAHSAAVSVRVDTVSVDPTETTVIIPVYLENLADSIAGFSLWVQLDRPDRIKFETTVDTLYDTLFWNCLSGVWPACVDSELVVDTTLGFDFTSVVLTEIMTGAADTAGTLMSGWEFLDSRSLSGLGWDIKISGIANVFSLPITPGIGQQSGGVLVNLVATLLPTPDTLTDRVVALRIIYLTGQTNFGDPQGNSLDGVYEDGSVTILPPSCCATPGDTDHSGAVTIADVTYGIGRIFSGFAPPFCGDEADANGDGTYSIADVTHLIAYIFSGGSAPVCGQTGS